VRFLRAPLNGGSGAVIGHEISWFNDSGSRYNADGNQLTGGQPMISKQFAALTALC
jgi:predicted metalloendopeptidase